MRKQEKNSRNYGMTGEDKDGKDKKAETGAGSDRALAGGITRSREYVGLSPGMEILDRGKTGGTVYRGTGEYCGREII